MSYPGVVVGFEPGTSSGHYDLLDISNGFVGLGALGPFSLLTLSTGVVLLPGTDYRFRAWITLDGTTFSYGEYKYFATIAPPA